jgi:DeoR/GlpR family transcriptional regulator of sugar metabolism
MMPKERRYKIIDILYQNKSATVVDLCDQLNASEATIRRDLTTLEEEGKLERVHGGAIIRSNVPLEKEESFNEKEGARNYEKRLIAQKAFTYLRDNDSIFLDGGTTTLELAKILGKSHIKLSVFTNSPYIAQYIARNDRIDLFIVGGPIRSNTLAVVGQLAIETIRKFRLDKVFIGVNGISTTYGLTTQNFEEAQIKKAILERGRERIILSDPTKFNKVALCEILPVASIDKIITTVLDDDDIKRSLLEEGVEVIEAQEMRGAIL